MTGLCIEVTPKGALFVMDGEAPSEGYRYLFESATTGSLAQSRAREALITEYWKSGLHPKFGGDPRDTLRDQLKLSLGEGMEAFHWGYFQGGKIVKGKAKTWEDVPEECRRLYREEQAFIVGKLKSFTKYTKKQMTRFIDNLIDEMRASGVNSKKFDEILRGMESPEEKVSRVFGGEVVS